MIEINNSEQKNTTLKTIYSKLKLVLETSLTFSQTFQGLSEQFRNDHDRYSNWLREKIIACLSSDDFKDAFKQIGIDWITLHYRTRHTIQDRSDSTEWLQIALPIQDYMYKYEKDLRVYEKGESPYITYFAENIAGKGTPLKVFFKKEKEALPKDWLGIEKQIAEYLIERTKGQKPQGDFDQEEVERCSKISLDTVRNVKTIFNQLSNQSVTVGRALGWLRNSCRVTSLALEKKDPKIKLPRIVILAPVYVEGNVIGGIAFVGNKMIDDMETSILRTFTDSLLSNIRLREEGFREARVSYIEELNNARAEFVQRISHSIQNPVESLIASIGTMGDLFKNIKESANELNEAATNIMQTFGREDIDDFLRVKLSEVNIAEFIDTLLFRNEPTFQSKGLDLTANEVPEEWNIVIDKTSFWQVMNNLLDNARKFAKKNVSIIIEKRTRPEEKYLFRIIDDGPGVDPTIKDKLFKPGIRAKIKNKKNVGHGFGLYLSRRAIKKLGGDLYFNESSDKGTEFVIDMPQKK